MKTRRRLLVRAVLVLFTLLTTCAVSAQDIVRESGVRGGLIVHLGCGDGEMTVALRADERCLVEGLDPHAANVQAARVRARGLGMLGSVSFQVLAGRHLPYIDNMVNLLVVSDDCGIDRDEMMRVLAPGGVLLNASGANPPVRKPWPTDIDSWTHVMHAADGNPVAADNRIGHPEFAQWIDGPRWARHHDGAAAGVAVMVSDAGRLFTIRDEGLIFSSFCPSEPVLFARDAFNGKHLWKVPLSSWPLRANRGNHATSQRLLVAHGDRVYASMGFGQAVSVLDAATGRKIRDLEGSARACEVIVTDERVFVCAELPTADTGTWGRLSDASNPGERRLLAYSQFDGHPLWQKTTGMFPNTLCAAGEALYYHDTKRVIRLEAATGERTWAAQDLPQTKALFSDRQAPIMLVQDGVVLYSMSGDANGRSMGDGVIHAYDADSGRELWTAPFPASGNCSPKDIFVINRTAYIFYRSHGGHGETSMDGLDLRTGRKVKEFQPADKAAYFHARCHRYRATTRYVIPSNHGFELVDVDSGAWDPIFWKRGACNFGYLPANGLLYLPAAPCVCLTDSTLKGTYALGSRAEFLDMLAEQDEGGVLEIPGRAEESEVVDQPGQWPTYRADAARRGCTSGAVKPGPGWTTQLGGKLTAPTAAAGKVFVARVDGHSLHALNAVDGTQAWSFIAGGRIDSPPTIVSFADGATLCIFGCHDGRVYALDAEHGRLEWCFRAAPANFRMNAMDQVESLWPVHGSVLLENNRLYCVAGRSIYLPGGLRLLQLDPRTGEKLAETVLTEKNPATGEEMHFDTRDEPGMPVALPDILSSDGKHIYMRSQRFDLDGKREWFQSRVRDNDFRVKRGLLEELMQEPERHLFTPIGFLDGAWFHRTHWLYGNFATYASGQHTMAQRLFPSGKIMVLDDEHVYTYSPPAEQRRWLTRSVENYRLMRTDLRPELGVDAVDGKAPAGQVQTWGHDWATELPVYARAMVKAGDHVFVAGPPDIKDRNPSRLAASWRGELGGSLITVDAAEGRIIDVHELESPPVWDGMASAGGRLFISLLNGDVICPGGPGPAGDTAP